MKRKPMGWWAVLVIAAWPLLAPAEVVFLKDGTVREGEIVRRDAEGQFLILKVDQQGITATMRINFDDIQRIEERRTSTEVLTEEYQNRRRHAESEQSPALFEELGDWCERNSLYNEAIEVLGRAAELDENRTLGVGIKVSRIRTEQGRPDLARHALEALGIQFPDNPLVSALLTDLDEQAAKVAADMIALAIDRFRRERYDDAIGVLNRLQRIRDPKVFERAEAETQRELGWSVAQLMATGRLQRPCPHCSPNLKPGLVVCPTCKGKCFFEKTEQVVELIDAKGGQPARKRIYNRTVEKPCPQCKGFGYVLCPFCRGAGRDFGDIGDMERPVFISMLRDEADRISADLDKPLNVPGQVFCGNCEPVLLKAKRLEYFLGHLFLLDADLRGDALQKYVQLRQKTGELLLESGSLYRKRTLADVEKYDAQRLEQFIIEQGIVLPELPEEPAPAEPGPAQPAQP